MDIIKSSVISLYGAQNSMQGGRPENQDDMGFLDTPLGFLLLVCDGMGGGPGGKTASYIVKHEVGVALSECSLETDRATAMRMAIGRAQEALEQKMREVPSLNGMGSTIVALLINKHSAIVAHTGDSRCYRLHGKRCLYRSQDHSLVAELVKRKVMTEEQARVSPQSNVITRGLGSVQDNVPEIDEVPYVKGDRFVLCSDGVWGIMPHKDLLIRFTDKSDIQNVVSNLSLEVDKIGFAAGGNHDNHTIVMVEMGEDSVLKDIPTWRKKLFFVVPVVIFSVFITLGIISLIKRMIIPEVPEPEPGVTSSGFIPTGGVTPSSKKNTFKDSPDSSVVMTPRDSDESQNINELVGNVKKIFKIDSDSVRSKAERTDSIANMSKAIEMTQEIINKYDSARQVKDRNANEAQKKLNKYRKHINALMAGLLEQSMPLDVQEKAKAIGRQVNQHPWKIDREVVDGMHGVTRASIKEMNIQIDSLSVLKEILISEKQE